MLQPASRGCRLSVAPCMRIHHDPPHHARANDNVQGRGGPEGEAECIPRVINVVRLPSRKERREVVLPRPLERGRHRRANHRLRAPGASARPSHENAHRKMDDCAYSTARHQARDHILGPHPQARQLRPPQATRRRPLPPRQQLPNPLFAHDLADILYPITSPTVSPTTNDLSTLRVPFCVGHEQEKVQTFPPSRC